MRIVVLVLVGIVAAAGLLAVSFHQIPDINPRTNANGVTAQQYADIKVSIQFAYANPGAPLGLDSSFLSVAAASWTVHEVTSPPTGTASFFELPLGTIGETCTAQIELFWNTPDDSGTLTSPEKPFTVGATVVFSLGHLNVVTPGAIGLSAKVFASGCSRLTSGGLTQVGGEVSHNFQFDGVDGN